MIHPLFKIFFIIGASGAGKTTTVSSLEKMALPKYQILYFDRMGIPSENEMVKQYQSPEEWQKAKTSEWIKNIKNDYLVHSHVILDIQTRPQFIETACQVHQITNYKIILFDCSDSERVKRLKMRGQLELANQQMFNWASYLRKECEINHYPIIDNTALNPQETLDQLIYHLPIN